LLAICDGRKAKNKQNNAQISVDGASISIYPHIQELPVNHLTRNDIDPTASDKLFDAPWNFQTVGLPDVPKGSINVVSDLRTST
jgi:hypothetical protein